MKPGEIISTAKDALTVKRVIGEPYEKDGVTVIPAAVVRGGGGAGGGTDKEGQEGGGGGFGVNARPAGAFIIRGDRVRWQPAVDPNRIIVVLGAAAVAVAYLLTRGRASRR